MSLDAAMSGTTQDTLLFATISAVLIGTCYYKPGKQPTQY